MPVSKIILIDTNEKSSLVHEKTNILLHKKLSLQLNQRAILYCIELIYRKSLVQSVHTVVL